MTPKAYLAEWMHPCAVESLHAAGIETVTPGDQFQHSDIGYLVVRSVFRVDDQICESFPKMRIVAKLGTGIDNIDQEACHRRGIEVIHAPGMNAVSTAEFIVTQTLAVCKNAFEIHSRVRAKDYRRHLYFGQEIAELFAGVIGYGNVGKHVVERFRPFVRTVSVYDPKIREVAASDTVHLVHRMEDLLKHADIVVLSVSLQGNEGMVNRVFLDQLKHDCLLVNGARGGLVDEALLYDTLRQRPKMRYFCDVLLREPDYEQPPQRQEYRNALLDLPNVFFTPHIASLTDACQRNVSQYIATKIIEHACATA